MKKFFFVMGSALVVPVLCALGSPSHRTDNREVFARALSLPAIADALEKTHGEIISLKQNFILAGRVSHTNVEITYGALDGVGGHHGIVCMALQLVWHARPETSSPNEFYLIPAPETCRG